MDDITRRDLLVLAGAAAVASAVPVGATVTEVTRSVDTVPAPHPFLGVQPGAGKFEALRLLYDRDNRSLLGYRIVEVEPTHLVADLSAAEDLFLEQTAYSVSDYQLVSGQRTGDLYAAQRGKFFCDDMFGAALAIMTNWQANTIATRMRRAPGNVVLLHPDNMPLFADAPASSFSPTIEPGTLHYWKREGLLNNTMVVYSHEKVRRDRVIVLYKGHGDERDAGGFVRWTPNGIELHIVQNDERCLGNATDYVGVVGLEA